MKSVSGRITDVLWNFYAHATYFRGDELSHGMVRNSDDPVCNCKHTWNRKKESHSSVIKKNWGNKWKRRGKI